jgi:hypothetical protein
MADGVRAWEGAVGRPDTDTVVLQIRQTLTQIREDSRDRAIDCDGDGVDARHLSRVALLLA